MPDCIQSFRIIDILGAHHQAILVRDLAGFCSYYGHDDGNNNDDDDDVRILFVVDRHQIVSAVVAHQASSL